jgi:hypothetical protein
MEYTAETPAKANEFVHQLDEQTGNIVTSRDLGLPINRYRFFWGSSTISGSEEVDIVDTLRQVLPSLGEECRWVLSWQTSQPTAARSRFLHSRRIKEGWEVLDCDSICLATKPIEAIRRCPEGYEWRDGGLIILVVEKRSAPRLVSEETLPTLEDLALSGKLRPGLGFLKFLVTTATSCVYFARDDLGRTEVIVLTNKCLPLDSCSSS